MRVVESQLSGGLVTKCVHCDELAFRPIFQEGQTFCCEGCLTVYQVLHAKGLEEYYAIKDRAGIYKRRSPVEVQSQQYAYLDEASFRQEYSYTDDTGNSVMEFYLEGIHCLACLWLVEKLPFIVNTVLSAKLDMEKSVATITSTKGGSFAEVAQILNQLGYRPHALKRNEDSKKLKTKENRQALLRIGIAAAGASNIMLYAVSLYGGAEGMYAQVFNALTVVFGIPVLTYSAYPFYKSAYFALKNKMMSIDVPISMALVMGLVMGIYNLLAGVPENYFDSLTALVFLLLLSRYFLKQLQDRALSAQDLHFFYQSESVLRQRQDSTFEEVHPKYLKQGDVLKIKAGDFFPVDGEVVFGASSINASLLSGESYPQKVAIGHPVFAGTQNLNHELMIVIRKLHGETRLGKILKNVENGWTQKAQIVELTDKIATYFISTVFVLAVVTFLYFASQHDVKHALEQALTLLIVTCPCALALATPLTFTRTLSKAAEQGIIIKNDAVIQKISEVKNVILDKTGTVTAGKMKVAHFKALGSRKLALDLVFTLEAQTKHPVGKALREFAQEAQAEKLQMSEITEVPGVGVFGVYEGQKVAITRDGLVLGDEKFAEYVVSDVIRIDSRSVIQALKDKLLTVWLISGDRREAVEEIADQAGIDLQHARCEKSPEDKKVALSKIPKSMMVGDGANDAIALSTAFVGVAVYGAMDISLRAADVYLTTPGLKGVEKLVTLSHETMRVIRRNLVLSLAYNSLSVLAVLLGLINPLVAAIIMPLSSLTVLVSTMMGTKKMRQLWKS